MFIEILLLISALFGFYIMSSSKPKQYKKIKKHKVVRKSPIDRNRFSKKKIPKDLDVIVIGSGIGGLSLAAFLSRVGKKVLVLEQHYIAGGCTHAFEEHGIEHETGIHYIGNMEKRKKVLDLITNKSIEWCSMGDVYDEIVIGDKSYDFKTGEDNFVNEIGKHFPGEKKAIRDYLQLVKKISQKDMFFNLKIVRHQLVRKVLSWFIGDEYYKYVSTSAYDVIKTFTKNEDLIAVLCGQYGDYGPTPKKASFFIHASIVNHYLNGGYYPKGGPGEISRRIIPVIEEAGGAVLVAKKVDKIIIKNGIAIGIRMESGIEIFAKKIVSSTGIKNTFTNLITHKRYTKYYNNILNFIPPSNFHVYLFVNLKGSPEELKLRSSNIWILPERDFDAMLEKFHKNPLEAPIPMFMGFSCAKDKSWSERYPGKSNAIILTVAEKDTFKKWEDGRCMHRDKEYKEIKEKYAQRLLEEGLFRFYPHLRDKVEHYEIGTPLSTKFYINSFYGESYGLDSNSYRYTKTKYLRPDTPIKNFYLSGQDICTLGFTGALMSGVLTAHTILGYGTLLDVITNRNLIKDLTKL